MAATVYGKPFVVTFTAPSNGECVDTQFWGPAPYPVQVTAVSYRHAVAGDDAGAVNLQLSKLTGTTALGSGTDLLTNNTNAGFNCKGTAQTNQTGTLTATTASLQLAAGNCLEADFAGTVATLSGVLMEVTLVPIA